MKNDKQLTRSTKYFIFIACIIVSVLIIWGTIVAINKPALPEPETSLFGPSGSAPVIKPTIATPLPLVSNPADMSETESKVRMLQLINPLLNKYSILIKSIDTQTSFWKSLNQIYISTIANLQKLQSTVWRNDVQGVIDQLLYEKDLLSKYVDLAKARQSYAKGMLEGYNTAYNKFGTQPFDDKFIKTVNDAISKIDGYISEYNMDNPDSVSATLKARASKIDVLVKELFQRLQTSQ